MQKHLFLLNKIIRRLTIIAALLFFISCNNKFLRHSPIPDNKLPLSDQLKYLVKTNEQDRKSNALRLMVLQNGNNKKLSALSRRDSARCYYLLKLIADSSLIKSKDKFNAALILMDIDGHDDCSDTSIVAKSIFYYNDLRISAKNKSDSTNIATWHKMALNKYSLLHKKCLKN